MKEYVQVPIETVVMFADIKQTRYPLLYIYDTSVLVSAHCAQTTLTA